jgi:signal transduction histidine kinase
MAAPRGRVAGLVPDAVLSVGAAALPYIGPRARDGPGRSAEATYESDVLSADPVRGVRPYAEVVAIAPALRSLWAEPAVPDPPARVWRDWVLVAALLVAAALEGALRPDVVWRPAAIALAVVTVLTLLWRRTHPLAMVSVPFGIWIVTGPMSEIAGLDEPFGLYTSACVLVLAYALFRWGSGRQMVIGFAVMAASAAVSITVEWAGVVDAVTGLIVLLLFPTLLGWAVRWWTTARGRQLDQMKLREREQLARDLHDTVAHHVSAITIRAQAGQVVAATDPAAALDALRVIEGEATRTLAEMRTIVGVLRRGESADLVPQQGVADIHRLRGTGHGPQVEVTMTGDLDDVAPSLGAALYRIAQESVTNAMRHARHATRVDVHVVGEDECVRMTVRDDGDATAGRGPDGYGIVGMTERATLLGGALSAGPGTGRGWTVDVVLPRTVPA